MYHSKSEIIRHVLKGCTALAPMKYLKRHDNVARIIHEELCIKANVSKGVNPILQLYYKPSD